MSFEVKPVTLVGRHVRLEPLQIEYAEGLFEVGNEPDIWRYMPVYGGVVNSVERMRAVIEDFLAKQAKGTDLCFATFSQVLNKPIGMTRYLDIQPANRGIEVGGTWLGKDFRRTAANTEAKYLMFTHAFETLGCIRVQLKTDLRNERSQRAIERIGAVREGVLRNNIIMPDGYQRSSVYYSILDDEWPAVKARLESFLEIEN